MNTGTMTAAETARYSVRASVAQTARYGLNVDGIERSDMIGRKAQREAGGRPAVLAAVRALCPISEIVLDTGYVEFFGRNVDGAAYRVIVI